MFDPLAESEFQTCAGCRRVIDPAAHDTVYAIELVKLDTPRGRKYLDGPEIAFHETCFRVLAAVPTHLDSLNVRRSDAF